MSISLQPSLSVLDRGIARARRRLNASIYERALQLRVANDAPIEFMCECGAPGCDGRLDLFLPQFDRLRGDGPITAHA